jgi:F0F1-type ATP synthase membrane subunit b/b'
MEELKIELKEAESEEEREEIREEMDEIVEEYFEEAEEIVGSESDAAALFVKRKEVYETNERLRDENKEIRKEYRQTRNETVTKYRAAFIKRLGNALDRIPNEKLENVLDKIDTLIERYESSENVSEERKDKILGQLIALKEIIEEKLEGDDVEDEVNDLVEELLSE